MMILFYRKNVLCCISEPGSCDPIELRGVIFFMQRVCGNRYQRVFKNIFRTFFSR